MIARHSIPVKRVFCQRKWDSQRQRNGTPERTELARAMRRERRGGDADAEAPQAFKEGASTLRNAQNRIHIGCTASAWGLESGDRLSMSGRKKKGATHYRVAPVIRLIRISHNSQTSYGNGISQSQSPVTVTM